MFARFSSPERSASSYSEIGGLRYTLALSGRKASSVRRDRRFVVGQTVRRRKADDPVTPFDVQRHRPACVQHYVFGIAAVAQDRQRPVVMNGPACNIHNTLIVVDRDNYVFPRYAAVDGPDDFRPRSPDEDSLIGDERR